MKTITKWLILSLIPLCAACSSDSKDGDVDYFSRNQMQAELSDGTTLFLSQADDGGLAVTFDGSNPLHLDADNNYSASIDTYEGDIKIPSQVTVGGQSYTITAVGRAAFLNNRNLKTLVLPETVRTLGTACFGRCTSLTSINLPGGITEIPTAAFANCSKITSLDLPSTVTTIADKAFYGLSKAKKLELPDGLQSISEFAFMRASALTELSLPATVTSVGKCAFNGDSKLSKLHVLSTTPPELTDSVTDRADKIKLYVPTGSKAAYENHPYWGKFNNIIEE